MGLKPDTIASSFGKGHWGGGETFRAFPLELDDDCLFCDTS